MFTSMLDICFQKSAAKMPAPIAATPMDERTRPGKKMQKVSGRKIPLPRSAIDK